MDNLSALGPYVPVGILVAIMAFREWQNYQRGNTEGRRLNDVVDRERTHSEQFTEFNASLLLRVTKLEEKVAELTASNASLQVENENLKTRLLIMESAHQDAPIPMWLKDTTGIMLALNPAYEAEFLAPLGATAKDYVGKTDLEFWQAFVGDEAGAVVAKDFAANDLHVQATRVMWLGVEKVADASGRIQNYAIMKYPRLEGNFLIGIAGIAIPKELIDKIDLEDRAA